MSNVKLEDLCPGIRGAVKFLWDRGWKTTDSGDGSHYRGGFTEACREPMIVVEPYQLGIPWRTALIPSADRILKQFQDVGLEPHIELTYSPNDGQTTLLVTGECLRNI